MDLSLYVDAWAESADRTLALLDAVVDDAWELPTGCPGWRVRDVVAHLAALESELAGTGRGGPAQGRVDGGEFTSAYTEAGVRERDDATPREVVDELREAVEVRKKALASLPDDPSAAAGVTPGGIGWSNETLLRNRMVDMFVHEQDLRGAVGAPGGYDGRAGALVVGSFLTALPYVLAKRLKAEPGTELDVELTGGVRRSVWVEVGDGGRGRLHDGTSPQPTARVSMAAETFLMLVSGREALHPLSVTWTGDSSLVGDLLAEIAVTP
ncbi:maleylpyruvate isomerase family mycothiol-dependent enzyme [Mumia sp. zg.B17]|uniref:maleylpyruvate isomerase family mycothiol-dependent enzyme n=1 Tax=Mumia sp. zg.B17 TaxID=2855446 RepID=UPI001C6E3FAD|nr:maleylpyruvate isomerase family mycothiol-dependent enzyme [Mumia sp. zg.B17]MBW9204341.1 maleylpyruvate isomerase family mycothiol-dependent enzyme [Mumia sp. zg.B17]